MYFQILFRKEITKPQCINPSVGKWETEKKKKRPFVWLKVVIRQRTFVCFGCFSHLRIIPFVRKIFGLLYPHSQQSTNSTTNSRAKRSKASLYPEEECEFYSTFFSPSVIQIPKSTYSAATNQWRRLQDFLKFSVPSHVWDSEVSSMTTHPVPLLISIAC